MKAVLWKAYGDPQGLEPGVIDMPQPGDDDILVRIHAGSVTAGDCEIRTMQLPLMLGIPMRFYTGLFRPKRIPVLGQEFAGRVEKTGVNVRSFREGDRVFGTTGFNFGANAEYICIPEEPGNTQGSLACIPDNASFREAAVLPTAGLEAIHFIRSAAIKPGSRVLVIGGGGSIGTCSIQLANHFGADVTGVDSTSKQDLMRQAGAHHTIDHTAGDYATRALPPFDLIIDVVGRKGVPHRLKLLKLGGTYFLAYAGLRHIMLSIWTSLTSRKKLLIQSSEQTREEFEYLVGLMQKGVLKPFIDRTFTLEQLPEAHRYAESGRKLGHIAIQLTPPEPF